jgi:membrane-associated protein
MIRPLASGEFYRKHPVQFLIQSAIQPALLAASLHSRPSIGELFDPTALLQSVGPFALLLVVVMVFIETGLLFPFLPGDSLVFAAALLSVPLGVPLWVLIPVVAAAAIAGGHSGYAIGQRLGPRLFKPDARIFKTRYRDEADAFFRKYGAGALVLARFVPIVRTFIPPIVGASQLRLATFALWNAVGGVAWALVLGLAGFWLGKISFVADNVDLIAVALVVVSVLPIAIGMLRRRARGRSAHRGDVSVSRAASGRPTS